MGATTENPSYELTSALLSRCRVVILRDTARRTYGDTRVGCEYHKVILGEFLEEKAGVEWCRMAKGTPVNYSICLSRWFNITISPKGGDCPLNRDRLLEVNEGTLISYDKTGDEHYNCISAFIKSVRGSDPDAALYYLARMLRGGEDPIYIARRLVILASEDIGNGDPRPFLWLSLDFRPWRL